VDKLQWGSDDHSLDDVTVFTASTISTTPTMESNDEEASQLQPRVVIGWRLHSKLPSVAIAQEDVSLHSNAPSVETTLDEKKPLECAALPVHTIRDDDTATLELSTPFQVQSKGGCAVKADARASTISPYCCNKKRSRLKLLSIPGR
jgi:hypothetical protein